MFKKNRQHDRRGDHGNHSKLSTTQVLEIKHSLLAYKELAQQYNMSYTAIFDIKHKRTWKHL